MSRKSGKKPLVLAALAWLVVAACAEPSFADVRTWIAAVGGRLAMAAGGGAPSRDAGLARAVAQMAAIPVDAGTVVLAAHAGQEGHWTFVNRSGERFTAGTPDELGRVLPVLAPAAPKDNMRLEVVISGDSAFTSRDALRHLSRLSTGGDADRKPPRLRIALHAAAYPLMAQAKEKSMRLFAEVRPRMLVELTSSGDFDEAVWQLSRHLRREHVRIVALEPGGPAAFTALPRLDPRTRRALTDTIDPAHLIAALPSIRRQTMILTGRIDGEGDARRLHFRTSASADRSLLVSDLAAGAAENDIDVLALAAATPRQPGARNWLWLPVAVGRLDEAVARSNLADFLDVMTTADTRLLVSLVRSSEHRVELQVTPLKTDTSTLSGIGDALGEVVSEAAGRLVVNGLTADLRSHDRQVELDARVLPGIPSLIQLAYLALLALGLLGWGPACRWWAMIWPREQRQGYAGLAGYVAAGTIRLIAFVLAFLPLVAPFSVPAAVGGALFRRRPAAAASRARS